MADVISSPDGTLKKYLGFRVRVRVRVCFVSVLLSSLSIQLNLNIVKVISFLFRGLIQ